MVVDTGGIDLTLRRDKVQLADSYTLGPPITLHGDRPQQVARGASLRYGDGRVLERLDRPGIYARHKHAGAELVELRSACTQIEVLTSAQAIVPFGEPVAPDTPYSRLHSFLDQRNGRWLIRAGAALYFASGAPAGRAGKLRGDSKVDPNSFATLAELPAWALPFGWSRPSPSRH